ncbi:MAG: hypothetical protein E6J90_19160 [Deltaproteobacteria bacterium]|nr:MAG: hypothetical protein E6J91_31640 [Deltaproteobacteria bacterium]TMQ18908.1 MAG: hypothetical protein E6J90_19160 [Deltaproteobacteria bacterium]
MGSGGSRPSFQDAAFDLRAGVPAGTYHVECDAVITASVDVTFTLIWRRGSTDNQLVQWTRHWDPLPAGKFDAQPYEVDMAAGAIDFRDGDQLVFRYAAANTTGLEAFIPNGDGVNSHGRIPSITLP